MFTILIAAQTAVLLSGAAPAATPQAAAPSDMSTPAAKPAEKRYCVVDTVTGSRIPQKVCKTRKEWMAESQFDPLNP